MKAARVTNTSTAPAALKNTQTSVTPVKSAQVLSTPAKNVQGQQQPQNWSQGSAVKQSATISGSDWVDSSSASSPMRQVEQVNSEVWHILLRLSCILRS